LAFFFFFFFFFFFERERERERERDRERVGGWGGEESEKGRQRARLCSRDSDRAYHVVDSLLDSKTGPGRASSVIRASGKRGARAPNT